MIWHGATRRVDEAGDCLGSISEGHLVAKTAVADEVASHRTHPVQACSTVDNEVSASRGFVPSDASQPLGLRLSRSLGAKPTFWKGTEAQTKEVLRLFLQESQGEGGDDEDNADIHQKPLPELASEEEEVDTNDNNYQREHEKRGARGASHPRNVYRVVPTTSPIVEPRSHRVRSVS